MRNNQLEKWDSHAYKFTLADHRRLAELLVKVYPDLYVLNPPQSIIPEINQFIRQMYSLSKNKYGQLMKEIDKELNCTWWRMVEIKFYQYTGSTAFPADFKQVQGIQLKEKVSVQTYSQKVLKQLSKNKKYSAISSSIQQKSKAQIEKIANKRIQFKPSQLTKNFTSVKIEQDQPVKELKRSAKTFDPLQKIKDFQRLKKLKFTH